MSQHSTLSLVIPAKNEQENIAKLLTEAFNVMRDYPGFEVVLVDDGSSDQTLATARRIELHPGCSLRIYNAIILPSRLPTAFDFPPSSKHSADNKSSGSCDKNIICTNLCERISSLN